MEDITYDDKELVQLLQAKDRMDLYPDCIIEIEEVGASDLSLTVLLAMVEDLCVSNPEKISFQVYKPRDASTRNH